MYEVDFDLTIHIRGTVYPDDEPSTEYDLLDSIFPDGWEGEILDARGTFDVGDEE